MHTDEVYFRDTAHGLLVWAVGAVIAAALLAWAASSAVSGVAHVAGAATEAVGAATGEAASAMGNPAGYFSDMLMRSDHPARGDQAAATAESGRILTRALYNGDLPAADKTYLAQIVASRTGLSQPDAEKRVADVFDQAQKAKQQAADKAKEAADAARKTGVYVALWAFISLLVGAFSASYMATVGGSQRDECTSLRIGDLRRCVLGSASVKYSEGRGCEDALCANALGLPRLALHALDVPVDDGEVFILHALPLATRSLPDWSEIGPVKTS